MANLEKKIAATMKRTPAAMPTQAATLLSPLGRRSVATTVGSGRDAGVSVLGSVADAAFYLGWPVTSSSANVPAP